MGSSNELMWSDIKSSTQTPDQFLEEFKDNRSIISNFENYTPNESTIKKIKDLLNSKQEILKIFVMGAIWCGDSKREVPRVVKIENMLNNTMELHILFGVKINRLRAKGDSYWSARPPEAVDPKFDLSAVPTFYLFNKNDKYLGKIIERPKKPTLEEEIIQILEKNL